MDPNPILKNWFMVWKYMFRIMEIFQKKSYD